MTSESPGSDLTGFEIAVIGMAGRYPGARNLAELWRNVRDGVESIATLTDEQLLAAGVDPGLIANPGYVKRAGVLYDPELFDAQFFGITPRDAELLDPQHRFFLECAWEALEDAGYDSESYRGPIGFFGGTSRNSYLLINLMSHSPDVARDLANVLASDVDYLTTRVSYKLNLRGPSVDVQAACSTSLVAVHLACQSLIAGESDMALAGGVSLTPPQEVGYLYVEGGTYAADGHCHAFDYRASGMVGSNGVGIVVLKRLADALADGDAIRAVIRASAINNDGSAKVGYAAPSVDGQAEVIGRALALAQVDPESITYVEAHGTGTNLGDPIEIAGLTKAYRAHTEKKGFCAIGSLKTNIGHSNAAAGVGGLLKAVLSLQHGFLAPSLNFERPNPNIDFENSPFYVNTQGRPWPPPSGPRRAAVNSFGMGGTNAHVVLEEAPASPAREPARPWQLLPLSARTPSALDAATQRLREHLGAHPQLELGDVAYTLQAGRRRFAHRRFVVCHDHAEAVSLLAGSDPKRLVTTLDESDARAVAFMFPGQGAQYVEMGRDLYEAEPGFREQLDRCAELLKQYLDRDLRELLYPRAAGATDAAEQLKQTAITQPALFAVEYALAQLWMSWGVRPAAMIGHSIGEYVAACLAGVFSLEDALKLVAGRGRLMQSLPAGSMLAVPMALQGLSPLLGDGIDVAALNEESVTVVSGPAELLTRLEERLALASVATQRLHTSHAFHSAMMETIVAPFTELVRGIERRAPRIPYVSNLTGTWVTDAQAQDPGYWARHLRETVRFAAGLKTLLAEPARLLLEVGPGRTLSTLANRANGTPSRATVVTSMRHPGERQPDQAVLLGAAGRLWLAGVEPDWKALHARPCRRVPLPSYPFERKRYWVDPLPRDRAYRSRAGTAGKTADIGDWFYTPSWTRTPVPLVEPTGTPARWLLLQDDGSLGALLAERLGRDGHEVVNVRLAACFEQRADGSYALNPEDPGDYARLWESLEQAGRLPERVVHLWSLAAQQDPWSSPLRSFYSLVYLARALGEGRAARCELVYVSDRAHDVTGRDALVPENALAMGPCKVIPQEYPHLSCRSIDLELSESGCSPADVANLARELTCGSAEHLVAYRAGHRWIQTFAPYRLPAGDALGSLVRQQGVYLITGAFGGIGLEVARFLAQTSRARLALVGRSALPDRIEWENWLRSHPEADEVCRRIRRIQELERLGSPVLVLKADVADRAEMARAIEEAEARFGSLHGVVHAAGAEKAVIAITEAGPTQAEPQFRPRLQGLEVLAQVVDGRRLDFCLLISSLSAVLGGVGSVAYTAAHVFMDAFAARHNRTAAAPWLSVNWDRWFTWREAAAAPTAGEGDFFMTADEAQEALRRVLRQGTPPQLVVSTGALEARIDRWIRRASAGAEAASDTVRSTGYSRPELAEAFVAPRTPAEEALAAIWRDALGLEQVGVNDDFFELGGDSVLGLRIIAKANEAGLRLSPRQLFEHNTIAGLAAAASGGVPAPETAPAPPGSTPAPEAASAFPGARLDQKNLDSFIARLNRAPGGPPK